ncbi:MAG TPA: hypothetical protein DEP28_08425, partial [Bacteroidetes bacterium]|nr:hypothetical protein [Bacteroidota bacterium]
MQLIDKNKFILIGMNLHNYTTKLKIIFIFLIFFLKIDSANSDSIYYEIETSFLSENFESNKLEINLVNESNDTLLFIPDFIVKGINDSDVFINTRSNIYSNNLLYFLPKKTVVIYSGLIVQNFKNFPQMFLILPNSKLLIKFDTNEFNQINFDLNDKKIFTKLRVARKKIFDEFFMKEFSESTELPYNSILSL